MTQLARCEYIERRENVIAIGNSGTGKTHIALGLSPARRDFCFTTASALVNELMEARDEMRLLNLQKRLARLKLSLCALRGLQSWIGPDHDLPFATEMFGSEI